MKVKASFSRAAIYDAAFFFMVLSLAEVVAFMLYAWTAAKLRVTNEIGLPLPPVTQWLYAAHTWFPFLPLPWALPAFYSLMKRRCSTRALVYFSVSLIMTLLALIIFVETAMFMADHAIVPGRRVPAGS